MRYAIVASLLLSSCATAVPDDATSVAASRPVVVIIEGRGERIEVTAEAFEGPAGERLRRMTAPNATVMADVDLSLRRAD